MRNAGEQFFSSDYETQGQGQGQLSFTEMLGRDFFDAERNGAGQGVIHSNMREERPALSMDALLSNNTLQINDYSTLLLSAGGSNQAQSQQQQFVRPYPQHLMDPPRYSFEANNSLFPSPPSTPNIFMQQQLNPMRNNLMALPSLNQHQQPQYQTSSPSLPQVHEHQYQRYQPISSERRPYFDPLPPQRENFQVLQQTTSSIQHSLQPQFSPPPQHQQQHPLLVDNHQTQQLVVDDHSPDAVVAAAVAAAAVTSHADEKPTKLYKCPKLYCTKVYRNANGLKYHVEHGKCELDSTSLQGSTMFHEATLKGLQELEQSANIKITKRPYFCRVPSCNRKYKNLNGLKYHAKVAHPELDFKSFVKGHEPYGSPRN